MSVTCSVIITHLNCPAMLDGVIAHAKAHRNPEVEYELLIADQSRPDIHAMICSKYSKDKEVRILKCPKVDAGWPIDCAVKVAKGDYCCTLDVDAFPIHPKWLLIPIRLIKEFGIGMVGHRTGLDVAYQHKGVFFELNNYFRVSKTSLLKELSEQVGFLRPNAMSLARFSPRNHEYNAFSAGNDQHNLGNWADTGVIANWYMDNKRLGTKLSLCMNKFLGKAEYVGAYGMVLDDLVFHLVLGYAEDYMTQERINGFGADFIRAKNVINNGPTLEAIRSMVNTCQDNNTIRTMTSFAGGAISFIEPPQEISAFIDSEKKAP